MSHVIIAIEIFTKGADMKERQILRFSFGRDPIDRVRDLSSVYTSFRWGSKEQRPARSSRLLLGSVLVIVILLLAACGTTSGSENMATATPQVVRVNGFGTAANHPHAF